MKGKDPCWKGYEMIGTKKKRGKEVPNCVPANEGRDPDANSKLRRKVQNVERDSTPETPDSDASKPTDPCSDHSKQQRIVKRTIMSEEGNSQPDPKKRLIGTDSLVKAYKKDTPGESLDESFAMAFDYQGKPSVGPTASELYMKAQGGFAHHTDVQNEMNLRGAIRNTPTKKQLEDKHKKEIEDRRKRIKNRRMQLRTEDTPSDREIGTDSLVKKYKKETPGQKSNLDENFNMAWTSGIGVTLSAADCGIKIKGGFALHPDVIDQMAEIEEDVVAADKKGEVVAGHKVIKTDPKTREQIVVDVPSHVRKAPTGKKIIKTGNPNDGIPG
jgi:hypothetical protein